MYSELVPVPTEGGTVWHVLVTEPYMWRVEFACVSESAAVALRLAMDGVTGAIMEPSE